MPVSPVAVCPTPTCIGHDGARGVSHTGRNLPPSPAGPLSGHAEQVRDGESGKPASRSGANFRLSPLGRHARDKRRERGEKKQETCSSSSSSIEGLHLIHSTQVTSPKCYRRPDWTPPPRAKQRLMISARQPTIDALRALRSAPSPRRHSAHQPLKSTVPKAQSWYLITRIPSPFHHTCTTSSCSA